jgi:hypothetical protein
MADTRDLKPGTVLVVQPRPGPARGGTAEIVVVPRRQQVLEARSAQGAGAAGEGGHQTEDGDP